MIGIIIPITWEQSVSYVQEIKQLYLLEILVMVQRIELGSASLSVKDKEFNATHLIVTLLQLSVVRSIEKLSLSIKLQFPAFTVDLDLSCLSVLQFVKLESEERIIWICRDPGGFPTFPVQICDSEFSPSTRLGLSVSDGFVGFTVHEHATKYVKLTQNNKSRTENNKPIRHVDPYDKLVSLCF